MKKTKYGIRITLPENDFLRAPHLLGDDWEGYRWFETEKARDEAFNEMQESIPFYRRDENPSQVLTRVERDAE